MCFWAGVIVGFLVAVGILAAMVVMFGGSFDRMDP